MPPRTEARERKLRHGKRRIYRTNKRCFWKLFMMTNHQRKDAPNNAFVGEEFEALTQRYWEGRDMLLQRGFVLQIGISGLKKARKFDLGCRERKIVIECKSHRWTESDNIPSAKITVWNESMYYFYMVPRDFRKIFFAYVT
jgi:hypothetical protein